MARKVNPKAQAAQSAGGGRLIEQQPPGVCTWCGHPPHEPTEGNPDGKCSHEATVRNPTGKGNIQAQCDCARGWKAIGWVEKGPCWEVKGP